MQVHQMNLNIKAISALNSAEASVDVSDFPVYTLTKEAQFRFPKQFLNYFVMFGGLHIEQYLLVTHGQFTEGNGLTEIFETSSSATFGEGTAVDVNQIKRLHYCVQITFCIENPS